MTTCYAQSWISRTGNRLIIYFADANTAGQGENPLGVSAITGPFTATQNGNPIVLPAPTADPASKQLAMITFYLPQATPATTAQASDVWTVSAPVDAATAGGLPSPAMVAQTATNYTGQLRAPFTLPMTSKVMPIGANVGTSTRPYSEYHYQANLFKSAQSNNVNLTTLDNDGLPLTVSGPVSYTLWSTSRANGVDTKAIPTNNAAPGSSQMGPGQYYLKVTENNHSNPMTLTVSAAGGVAVSPITITPGSVSGNTETGKQFAWTLQRTSPGQWNLSITITFHPPVGATFPYTWSLGRDLVIVGPGNSLAAVGSNGDTAPSANVVAMMKAGNGTPAFHTRNMDNIWDSDGNSCVVSSSDRRPVDSYCWNNWSSIVAQVTAIRPLAFPATIYLWDSYGGLATASPGGSPGPYYVTLPTIAAFQAALGNSLWLFEVVFSAPHGFKTLQTPNVSLPNPQNILFGNAGSSTLYTNNLNGNFQPIWVTGANTIAGYVAGGPHGNGLFAQPIASQAASGYFQVYLPDKGSWTVEGCCAFSTALGSNNYLHIPICADSTLMTDMANTSLANLTPGKTLFIQLGNELWASQPQAFECIKTQSNVLNYPAWASNGYFFQALQSLTAYNIFISVFGAAGRASEIKLVMGSQYAGPNVTTAVCQACSSLGVPASYISVAPYLQPHASASSSLNKLPGFYCRSG